MVNDPISDFIIRIKNAGEIGKDLILVPYSEIKYAISEVLHKEGFAKSISKKGKKVKKFIEVGIAYKEGKPRVNGVKRISKPSKRIYKNVADLKPVKQGYGMLVLSTPKGILSGKEAKKEKVGGEALFEIW